MLSRLKKNQIIEALLHPQNIFGHYVVEKDVAKELSFPGDLFTLAKEKKKPLYL